MFPDIQILGDLMAFAGRLIASAGAFALIAASIGVTAGPAQAYDCGTASNWHSGFNTNSSSTSRTDLFGVRGVADVQQAKFCTGGGQDNFTNVYVMSKSANVQNYAQVGYERQPTNGAHPGIHHFAQIQANSLSTWYSASTIATDPQGYKVEHFGTLLEVAAYVNGDAKLSASYANWNTPFYIEISGEARYRETDIAGVVGNRVDVEALNFKDKDTSTWSDMPSGIFNVSADSSRWKTNSLSSTRKQFWTDPTN